MLLQVQHKGSLHKNGVMTYSFVVEDDTGNREVSWSMPLTIAIMSSSLSTIAVHQAYYREGREIVATRLNEYYNWIQHEGYEVNQIRVADRKFYQKAIASL